MALAGGSISSEDLADAMICEALEISWEELQSTPADVITYRLTLRREEARRRAAMRPLGGADGSS